MSLIFWSFFFYMFLSQEIDIKMMMYMNLEKHQPHLQLKDQC